MRRRGWAVGLGVGLAAAAALVAWQGAAEVARALAAGGWAVLVVVPLFGLPLLLATEAWRALFPGGRAPGFGFALHASWIGFGVNWLLPVAMVGGEAAKVRLMHRRGMDARLGTATVVVDKTVQVGTQVVYALLGLALLGAGRFGGGAAVPVLVGAALLAAGTVVFWRLQMRGLFAPLAGRILDLLPAGLLPEADGLGGSVAGGDAGAGPDPGEDDAPDPDARGGDAPDPEAGGGDAASGLEAGAEAADALVREIYREPRRWIASTAWRMGFRVLWAAEVWAALHLLGHPVGVVEAIIVESLVEAGRAAGFLLPGGLGAQEGAVLAAGAAVGVGPDTALALALVRRVRELGVGLPALAAWQLEEGWSAVAGR